MSIGSIASAHATTAVDALRLALRRGKTGCLTARFSDSLVRQVYVSQGEIFAAHAPEDGSWLVRRLINHGALTDRQGASFLRSIERGVSYEELLIGQVPEALLVTVLEARFRQTLAEFITIEGRADWVPSDGIFVANVQTGHDSEALLRSLLRRRAALAPILHRREPLTLRPGPANPARAEQARLVELCEPVAPLDDLLAFSPYEHWDTAALIIEMIGQGSLVSDEGLRISASRPPEVEDAYEVEELFSLTGGPAARPAPALPISFLNALAEPVELSEDDDFGAGVPEAMLDYLRGGALPTPTLVVEEPSIMPPRASERAPESKVLPFVPLEDAARRPAVIEAPDAWLGATLSEPGLSSHQSGGALTAEDDSGPLVTIEDDERDRGEAREGSGLTADEAETSEAQAPAAIEPISSDIVVSSEQEDFDENDDDGHAPEMVDSQDGRISLVNFRRDPIPLPQEHVAPPPATDAAPAAPSPEDLVQTAARYLEAAQARRASRGTPPSGAAELESWLVGEGEGEASSGPVPPSAGAWRPERDDELDPSLLALFEDQDDLRGLGDGEFSVADRNLDRVDMRAEIQAALADSNADADEMIEAVEADAEAEAEAINLNFGPPPLRDEEARGKLGVAADVLAKLAHQIDVATGPGSGSAAVQVLLESTPGTGRRLFSHVNTNLEGRFDLGVILGNLRRLPEAERRTVLDAGLLDLVERALAYACETLPAPAVDELLVGIAGYQQRLRG